MKPLSKLLLLWLFLLAIPAFSDFHSKYVDVSKAGGISTDDQGRLGFQQIITNTSQQAVWVTVRQGECDSTQKIEPKGHALFRCAVGELKPGKVPVAIAIYADEAKSQTLESLRDEMRFSRSEVGILKDYAAAQRLPITYQGIYYSPELGLKAAFRQLIPIADGKLTISTSALEYVDGKQKVSISTAVMRDVRFFRGANPPWAVVSYLEGDAKKNAGFAPLIHPDDLPRIVFSLMAAMKSGVEGTPKIPGETLGEPLLQRDTNRTILEIEKTLAPDCAAPKVVDTKVLEKPANVDVRDSRPVQGTWSERWIVDRCGTQVAYRVNYAIDPKGGTNIAIEKP